MSVASVNTRKTAATATSVSVKARAGKRAAASSNPFDISNVGWSNLDSKFVELMDLLDTPTSGINALESRARHREQVKQVIRALLDKAQDECRTLLTQGNGEAAEEAGVKVLALRERFYGAKHHQLIPAYLHLARAKQFMEHYGDAEDMLSLANYIAQKNQDNPELGVTTKAELHQTYGLLYAADEKYEIAVKHLTCASYYMSCLHGPQHVLTTFSYFDLGNVFAAKACMENSMAMYDSVKEIWHTFLTAMLNEAIVERGEAERMRRYTDEEGEVEEEGYASARAFGAENLVDASKMLHGIYAIQKERYRVDHPSTARAQLVLGMYLLWVHDQTEAATHLSAAHTALQRFYGPRHPVVTEVEEWCEKFDFTVETDPLDNNAEAAPETQGETEDKDIDQSQSASPGEE